MELTPAMKNEQNTMTLLTNAINAPAEKSRAQIVDELELSAVWRNWDGTGDQAWVTVDTAADAVLEAMERP